MTVNGLFTENIALGLPYPKIEKRSKRGVKSAVDLFVFFYKKHVKAIKI